MGSLLSFNEQETMKNRGVLIVDDMRMMRMIIASILRDAGIRVLGEAKNGQEALQLYTELNPAVVTLDLLMPVMDGFVAMEKLLAYDPNARIIVCSTLQHKVTIAKALRMGARDFLVKPFRPDKVRTIIYALLQEATFQQHTIFKYKGKENNLLT